MKINGKPIRTISNDSLAFHKQDLTEAIAANPQAEKIGQYQDELLAVNGEIARRQNLTGDNAFTGKTILKVSNTSHAYTIWFTDKTFLRICSDGILKSLYQP